MLLTLQVNCSPIHLLQNAWILLTHIPSNCNIAPKDKEIWVRYRNYDAVFFGQEELEKKNIHDLDDLKRLIKDQLQSLKDFSEDLIRLRKGKDILKASTSIADLYNTEDEALAIIIIGGNGMCEMIASESFEIYMLISDIYHC